MMSVGFCGTRQSYATVAGKNAADLEQTFIGGWPAQIQPLLDLNSGGFIARLHKLLMKRQTLH